MNSDDTTTQLPPPDLEWLSAFEQYGAWILDSETHRWKCVARECNGYPAQGHDKQCPVWLLTQHLRGFIEAVSRTGKGHYELFQTGWDAGFQEAQEPDRFPWQNRCEVRYRELFPLAVSPAEDEKCVKQEKE